MDITFLSDQDLIQLVQTRNQSALVALYDRYSSLVYSTALRILRDSATAEDVTQELFLKLWVESKQVQVQGESLHGWMMVVARNRSIDILRVKRPEPLGDLILASPSNPSEQTERRLICERLVGLLEVEEWRLVEMAFLKGMTHAEIAAATGRPLGTVKSIIRRALRCARRALAAPAHDPIFCT